MPDCDYCSASFEGEDAYYEHLGDEHYEELGRIDRRRVDEHRGDDETEFPTGPVILLGVIGVAALLVVYLIVFAGGRGSGSDAGPPATINGIDVEQTPGSITRSAHAHGPINVTIAGEQLDFGQTRFQRPREFPKFHFEGGDGSTWHGHAEGITLEYAMATLGIGVTDSSVTYDGTTYRDSDPGTSVSVQVNGKDVDPSTYELDGPGNPQNASEGDFVRIVVTTNESTQ